MTYDQEPEMRDPDIGGTKWFIGALVAIVLAMTGIYFFSDLDAVRIASHTPASPVTAPPEPSTPPPSTMSR